MKAVIFTSNSIRHKFFANSIAKQFDDALVICECTEHDSKNFENILKLNPIQKHFHTRYETEKKIFKNNDYFLSKTIPLIYKEVNLNYVYDILKKFEPDVMFVFGSHIIKEPILTLPSVKYFLNMHLGLSPYYRGSGTNFWPFVNNELEYVGSTILYLDSGIDTGDILCHVLPKIELGDDVHTVGCKVIEESVKKFSKIISLIDQGKKLPRTKQWEIPDERYYRNIDFNESILKKYKQNLSDNLIVNYLSKPQPQIKLLSLEFNF